MESEPATEKQEAKEAKRKYTPRGRALLRRPTDGKDLPLFPFDNDPKLTSELAWESGDNARWVFHGTPAGGLGLCGFLTSGLVVVASCAGPDHKRLLLEWTINRVGDYLVSDSKASIFSALAARYARLTGQPVKKKESSGAGRGGGDGRGRGRRS